MFEQNILLRAYDEPPVIEDIEVVARRVFEKMGIPERLDEFIKAECPDGDDHFRTEAIAHSVMSIEDDISIDVATDMMQIALNNDVHEELAHVFADWILIRVIKSNVDLSEYLIDRYVHVGKWYS